MVIAPEFLALGLVLILLVLIPARRLQLAGFGARTIGAYAASLWLLGLVVAIRPGLLRILIPCLLVAYLRAVHRLARRAEPDRPSRRSRRAMDTAAPGAAPRPRRRAGGRRSRTSLRPTSRAPPADAGHGPRLAARPIGHVPQPRLVRRLPRRPSWRSSAASATGWSRAVRFLTAASRPASSGARASAGFLNADPEGLAFVPNATTGVNTVLQSLRFQPGDELLTNDHEYNATLNAMQAVAARDGARVVVVPVPFPIHDPAERGRGASWPRSRRGRASLVVSHVTSPTALVFPIEASFEAFDRPRDRHARRRRPRARAWSRSTSMRSAPAYWTGNGHKWLCAPKGSGILWVRADRRERIRPLVISHGANEPLRRPLALPPRVRLDGHRRPDART